MEAKGGEMGGEPEPKDQGEGKPWEAKGQGEGAQAMSPQQSEIEVEMHPIQNAQASKQYHVCYRSWTYEAFTQRQGVQKGYTNSKNAKLGRYPRRSAHRARHRRLALSIHVYIQYEKNNRRIAFENIHRCTRTSKEIKNHLNVSQELLKTLQASAPQFS